MCLRVDAEPKETRVDPEETAVELAETMASEVDDDGGALDTGYPGGDEAL